MESFCDKLQYARIKGFCVQLSSRGGSTLGQREEGYLPPDSLVASPQIQKLADRSDVISEVPKCSKIQIFPGSAPDPA